MKSAYFIMKLWEVGNIGLDYNISKIEEQKPAGYVSEEEAEKAMLKMKRNGNWELSEGDYDFTIMKLYWR
jgi:hypothetical protein